MVSLAAIARGTGFDKKVEKLKDYFQNLCAQNLALQEEVKAV